MIDTHLAYPLTWPPTQPRTPRRERARFDTPFAFARDSLLHELRLLGARDVVISSNVPLRRDGYPLATFRKPDEPGVAVWFSLDATETAIACDRWTTVDDNLRAIGKTVEALRGIARWGSTDLMRAAFTGFAALPASSEAGWWVTLGVAPTASRSEIERAYREQARATHPDRGGDHEQFLRIKAAYEQAKAVTA